MSEKASELARRLARDAEAVCRRIERTPPGSHPLVGDIIKHARPLLRPTQGR